MNRNRWKRKNMGGNERKKKWGRNQRTPKHCRNSKNGNVLIHVWTPEMDTELLRLAEIHKPHWGSVAVSLQRTAAQYHQRYGLLQNDPAKCPTESPTKVSPSVVQKTSKLGLAPSSLQVLSSPRDYWSEEASVDVKSGKLRELPLPEYKIRLSHRLKLIGRKEKEVLGDGNCQFRALSEQLYGQQKFHKFVRELVVYQLESQPGLYQDFVTGTYKEFVNEAATEGEWGGHLTLQAASDVFQHNILVLTDEVKQWGISLSPQRTSVVWGTLYLTFHNRHYNSTTWCHGSKTSGRRMAKVLAE